MKILLEILAFIYIVVWIVQLIWATIGLFGYEENCDNGPFVEITRKRYLIAINPLWLFILVHNKLKSKLDEEHNSVQR